MENVLDKDRKLVIDIASTLEKYSMKCQCKGLAVPQCTQGRIYQCLSCHKCYEGITYNFIRSSPIFSKSENLLYKGVFQIDYFDDAIDILRRKNPVTQTTPNLLKKLWKRIKH